MLSHQIRRRMLLGTVSILALALFGCGGNSLSKPFGTNPNDTNQEREFNALVSSPTPAVNFSQRNVTLNSTPLVFGANSSYQTVSSGISIATNVFESGTSTSVAPTSSVTMTRNFFYTQVVTGIFGTSGPTAPQQIQLADNFPNSIPTSSVAIRLVNLSPDSPPISLYNTAGTPATAVAITGLGGVAYLSMSGSTGSNYITAAAGSYTLSVRDSAGNVLTSVGTVTLPGGHAYTVFFYGLVNPASGQQGAHASLLTDK